MDETPRNTDEMISRLGELYRKDPEAFEAMRKLLIEETIEGFPEKHRSRAYGLQFRLDAELSRYKDPVARMNRMVEIFWEGVYDFEATLNDPKGALRCREEKKQEGNVIPFPKKKEESLH